MKVSINTDIKILFKYQSQIQQYIKTTIYLVQLGCIPEWRNSLTFENKSMQFIILTEYGRKKFDNLIDTEKPFDKIMHRFILRTLRKPGVFIETDKLLHI